jgi:hypothetical protein
MAFFNNLTSFINFSMQVIGLDDASKILDPWVSKASHKEGRAEAAQRIRDFLNNPEQSTLDLSELELTELPLELFTIPALVNRLQILDLSQTELSYLPASIGCLTALTELNLAYNHLSQLPDSIKCLTALKKLDLAGNNLSELPEGMRWLTMLTELKLNTNQLNRLPVFIIDLTALKVLHLSNNRLSQLPAPIGGLTALTVLHLSSNFFSELPDSVWGLTALTELRLSNNKLIQLPDSIGRLTALTQLHLARNQLIQLPNSIGNLTTLTTLDLSVNSLPHLPVCIGNLATLKNFDLSYNPPLTALPNEILQLDQTCTIDVTGCSLSSTVREHIQQLTSVENYQGPTIHYSIPQPRRTEQLSLKQIFEDLGKSLTDDTKKNTFCDQTYKILQEKCSQNTNFALSLESWLSRLSDVADYMNGGKGRKQLAHKIVNYLILASEDESFFEVFKAIIEGSAETCGDRVTLSILHIGIQYAIATFDKSDVKGFFNLLARGCFAMNLLEQIARKKVKGLFFVDEIEVYLGFPIQLKERLKLPIDVNGMLFFHFSYITQKDLDAAAEEVERALADKENLHRFLISQTGWIEALNKKSPQKSNAIQTQIDELCENGHYEKAGELRTKLYMELSMELSQGS